MTLLAALLAATGAFAAGSPALDAALERARSEKKIVLAYSPSARTGEMLLRAEREPAIEHSLRSFVVARVESSRDISLLDPNGLLITAIDMGRGLDALASALAAARDATDTVVASAEARRAGKSGAADYLLGRALMTMGLYRRAETLLRKTANSLRYAGESDLASLAQASGGAALYLAGDEKRGRAALQSVIRNSRTPAVLAEAWYLIGTIEAIERNRFNATRAWRKAYELAPPGSPIANDVRRALEGVDQEALAPKTPAAPGSLRIIAPAKKTIVGEAQFEAVTDSRAARVEFFLDDVPVAKIDRPPFRATIDAGRTPAPRTVKAVAYDAGDAAIAEALLTINDRAEAFRVVITSPVVPVAKGSVGIEADVVIPQGRRLKALELFWNGDRLATFTAPPFRHTADIPGEFGYIRALATLEDGATAEAVRLLNASGAAETVDVQGVTFAAVITDARGNRVAGLRPSDLTVEEDGKAVPFTMREGESEPALIGLAIDSSSSMRQSMLRAFRYADAFIESGSKTSDRTFVVAFDSSPRLLQPATSDAAKLRDAVMNLRPAGGTSLFDGIAFALQQFEGIGGKRALVVITDGKDVRSSTSAEACVRLAQQIGVPVYAVSMSAGLLGNPLSGIATGTGGMFIPSPRDGDMSAVFARVRDEVRGQYLITFVSPKPAVAGAWRDLRVKVNGRDLRVRTVAGYRVP